MAGEQISTKSVVGDVTKAINDAWEFFLPTTIRAALATAVLAALGGVTPLTAALRRAGTTLSSIDIRNTADLLDKYKLTPLVPVVALFGLATLAYTFNRIVFAVANLIPIALTHSETTLLMRDCSGASAWYYMPYVDTPDALVQAIELELAKARAGDYQAAVRNVDYWGERTNEQLQQFSFAKFLALWSVSCAFVLPQMLWAPPRGIFIRLLFVLALIAIWASISLLRTVYSIKQAAHAKISATVVLLTAQGRAELPPADERRRFIDHQIEMLGNQGWWWITAGSVEWVNVLHDFDMRHSLIFGIRKRWFRNH